MSPTEHREPEWKILETKALGYLENVRQFTPIKPRPLLRLWCYPSFDAYYSWVVVKVKGQESPTLRQIIWNRPSDMERLLANPMEGLRQGFGTDPTIEVRDCILPQEVLLRLDISRRFNIPIAYVEDGIYLDGTQFGVETFEGFHNIRLSWSGNGPEAWRELTQWANNLRLFFFDLIDKQGVVVEV